MKKISYSSRNATKKTSKKVMNKIMPVKAGDGKTLRGQWNSKNYQSDPSMDHDMTNYDPKNVKPIQQDVADLKNGSLGDFGKGLVSTSNGMSPVDGWNGDQTSAYKYRKLQYEHQDAHGNVISSKDYGYDYEKGIAENSNGKWFDDNGVNPAMKNTSLDNVAPQPNPNPTTTPTQPAELTPKQQLNKYLGTPQPSVPSDDYNQFDPKWRSDNFMNPQSMPDSEPQQTAKKQYIPAKSTHLSISSNDMIAGTIGAINSMLPDQHKNDNQNRQPMMYNPRPYGDGTQAISKYGHTFGNGGEFTDMEDYNYDEAAAGIEMLGPGQIKPMGDNPYSHPMMWSQGPSHNEGGMPIRVGDQPAEIQGGEGIYPEANGDTTVFGGMKMPNLGSETKGLAGRTFQSIAKEIGKQEEKNEKIKSVADTITDNNDPNNKFDSLKLGSAMAMESAFKMRSAAATKAKDNLADVQRMMHEDADDQGVKYEKAHKLYGKEGFTTKAKRWMDDETPAQYDPNLTMAQNMQLSLKKRMNDDPNAIDPGLPAYKPSTRSESTGVIPDQDPAAWRVGLSDEQAQAQLRDAKKPTSTPSPTVPTRATSLADQNNIKATDFLGELSYLGKRPDQVLSPEYRPYLETPYQVSFQDRRNQNQATFNEVSRQLQGSGTAASLASLAGQKYEADNQVSAEEFRTNQGIFNTINNQNYTTLNDANKTNLALKDQQFVRQSQAKSNTDAQRAQALASISNKIAANRYENMNLRMVEQKSGYRWNPDTKKMEWTGGPYQFNPYGSGQPGANVPSGWTETQKYNKETGQWEDDTRSKKASSKFGNVFKKKS